MKIFSKVILFITGILPLCMASTVRGDYVVNVLVRNSCSIPQQVLTFKGSTEEECVALELAPKGTTISPNENKPLGYVRIKNEGTCYSQISKFTLHFQDGEDNFNRVYLSQFARNLKCKKEGPGRFFIKDCKYQAGHGRYYLNLQCSTSSRKK